MGVKSQKPEALRFELASDDENRRIGPNGTALIDYLLHPPQQGGAKVVQDIPHKSRKDRRASLHALIKGAFG